MLLSLSPPAGDADADAEAEVVGPRSLPLPLRITAISRTSIILLTCWTWLVTVAAAVQTLPYVPTSIFIPTPKPGQIGDNSTAGDLAYIFSPHGDSVDLLALDISATLVASSLTLNTLSSGLPFLENSSTAFVPSLADNGSLLVYAGDCSTSIGSSIWSFDPSIHSASSKSWTQEDIQPAADAKWIEMGPGFLGAGFSFSTVLEPTTSPANTFVYGGMCPNNESDPTSAQSKATYSNQMVKISPATDESKGYTVKPVDSSGPPIAEAGFTFTSLSPSFSNRSGVITQQIDYVLLGGHTQYAFINMSTLAIWSLPQESWSFVSDIAMAGSGSTDTELALKKSAVDSVDSRSGHTTVMNEDGTALVVFGGWVGDLTQAAFPQLAVLQIGSDYGADDEWQWIIPDSQPSSDGIYGHGAALLPGNVMIVYGGYSIPSTGTNNRRQTGSSTATFLNLTSMTWSDEYTNPSYTETSAEGSKPGLNSEQKQKLGLGVGLGVGLALLLLVAVLGYLYYRKRRLHRRTIRDSTINNLAQDNSRFLGHDDLSDYDRDGSWYTGGPDPYARGDRSLGYTSLQAGRPSMENSRHNWFGDIAPPPPQMMQTNRKPIAPRAARGQHQPTSSGGYEQVANPRGSGGMNPIFEVDEDDTGDIGEEAISPVRDGRRNSGAYSDPFLTPTQERPISFPGPVRQTPSPEDRKRGSVTDPEVQDWMTDVDAADALLSGRATNSRASGAGQGSPSRRGFNGSNEGDGSRTESNISESNRSNLSRSGSLLRQLRPGFGVAVAAALAATTEGRGGSSSSSSAPSYDTARSTFPALQAEGPALLMGRDRDRERERDEILDEDPQEPGSPSKNKPRRSWLGSLRRVFSNPSPGAQSGESDENSPLQSEVVETNDFEARLGSLGGIGGIAADGLLRRKGGRGAWEPSDAGPSQSAARSVPTQGGRAGAHNPDDEEWDIEKAVEKRLVQVMFTVPREPLRVVNAEPDFESERDVILVDPETGEQQPRGSEEQAWMPEGQRALVLPPPGTSDILPRPLQTPSPRGSRSKKNPGSSAREDAEKEALRRELDAEWERIEAEEALPPPQPRNPPHLPPPLDLEPRASEDEEHEIPRRPPLLHHSPLSARAEDHHHHGLPALTLEEQIDRLGAELQQARSAAHTPLSLLSQHSDAELFSAEAIRYERPPSGSTSTLQITPILTTPSALRGPGRGRAGTGGSSLESSRRLQTTTDFRSESNLRAENNSTSPVRRVRAMVEEFESKSSRDSSPAGAPLRPSSTKGTPTKGAGSPMRGR